MHRYPSILYKAVVLAEDNQSTAMQSYEKHLQNLIKNLGLLKSSALTQDGDTLD